MMINLETTFKLEGGEPGEDNDSYNPLARALANLLQKGQPFRRLTQCFVLDDRHQSAQNGSQIRWLGVFIYSDGGQVIFFPGFADPMTEIHLKHRTELELNQPIQFDHFSLLPDLQRWHITNEDSSEHVPRGIRTKSLGDGRYLWFGLSISNLDILHVVKETTLVTAQVPNSDAERRKRVFLDARENAVFQIIEFHPVIKRPNMGTAHFSIIVGNGASRLYEGHQMGLPYGSPYITEPLEGKELSIPRRQHQMVLSSDRDIQIDTAILPSELTYPVVVTSPSD